MYVSISCCPRIEIDVQEDDRSTEPRLPPEDNDTVQTSDGPNTGIFFFLLFLVS